MAAALSRRAFLSGAPCRPDTRIARDRCLAGNGVYCRSCADACASSAIRIKPVLGGRAEVLIDDGRCQGCADCVTACPVGAITAPLVVGGRDA